MQSEKNVKKNYNPQLKCENDSLLMSSYISKMNQKQ